MGRRTLLFLILVPFLLLTAGGCAAKREALRPDGASPSVRTRVPPAEAIGIRQWVTGHWEMERYSRHREDDEDDDGYSRGRRVWIPGRYEEVRTRTWLPDHWEERD